MTNPISISLNDKLTNLKPNLKCKDFYQEYIRLKTRDVNASAIYKWEETYYNYDFDWGNIFKQPYIICRETRLQSFQFQILNRYVACNELLCKWGKRGDTFCDQCNTIEDIEHLFYECKNMKDFWRSFTFFWLKAYGFTVKLNVTDILFGLKNLKDCPDIHALNFCVLLAKRFIYECNVISKVPTLKHFLSVLKNRIIIERYICNQNHQYLLFQNRFEPLEKFLL